LGARMENYTYKKVDKINFGIISPKQIKEISTAKIVTPELYDKEGYPVDGGLMDIRMGVIDPGLRCKTCGGRLKECLGHFGYIELARPVVHISFITVIYNLLRCTCSSCGHVLLDNTEIKKLKDELNKIEEKRGLLERMNHIKKILFTLKNTKICPHCNTKQKKISLEKPTTFLEDEKRLNPIDIRARLEKIPDNQLPIFGINPKFARPEWLVLTILPIPPVTMRPSITLQSGERSEDDLTHKLGDIVRINQRLFENINAGAPEIIIEDLWDLLQYHVTTFFDNNVAQLPPARHRSGQPLKTLTSRIKSKEGRIRYNLVGKRTNFSARTVISPDPKLELNEVGVPKVIALKLTVPEKITEWNKDYLKKFVEKGPKEYPGANYVIRPDGRRKKIADDNKEQILEELEPGFTVERHLMDGDIALFNRQPSLHRMSMMAHKIKVLPGLTLRLNPAVCNPYNADFDGDEMNLHIPQTPEARAEAQILLQVQTQIISPRYGLSVIGCNQDSVAGNYVLTNGLIVNKRDAIDILFKIGINDFSKLPNKKKITGEELFSVLIPKDFNFIGKDRTGKAVHITNGKLEGVLDKNNLSEGSGLLLRNLYKQYGPDKGVAILGHMYRLGNEILTRFGLSMFLSDLDVGEEAAKEIAEIKSESHKGVNKLIGEFKNGTLENLPGRELEETLELRILEKLNLARNKIGKLVENNAPTNTSTMVMVKSGARGNIIQLAQMAGCVGQQALRGGRISKGYKDRTLSCFKRGDLRSDARGFIDASFKSGLKPHEFFFMAMTGRDSLMDTALRTPKSGYLYRRLANSMQDLKVEYDYTVRDAAKRIIQFDYGEDGIDVSKSEGGKINVKHIIDLELKKRKGKA
jgi:DNA-directed RNA polymerase subunit A'